MRDAPGRREDAHELLERPEGLAELEADVDRGEVLEVGRERRVVVHVRPLPARAALVVVPQDPGEALDIAGDELAAELGVGRLDAELLPVVALLVAGLPQPGPSDRHE